MHFVRSCDEVEKNKGDIPNTETKTLFRFFEQVVILPTEYDGESQNGGIRSAGYTIYKKANRTSITACAAAKDRTGRIARAFRDMLALTAEAGYA